ncbi:SLBB domain-containing protein [Dysgonomonas sp. Marseille-P4677]|uniref:SLBB domain-containing protein n=1 Tax=Dysgonomonas sp. Marseille-P4677 TaxID=2364790 RepID=UPI001914684D|nr:SLBB domain-containing protein [Dysgonomonas sp. Marseille-P4677]MBK5719460.1 SLBB domain-containing protein [Dysgonomonas sp. Marseille-P4677]
MKKLISYFLFFILSVNLLYGQMADNQVLDYVKTEMSKGSSQQKIAEDLLRRGVTPVQLERIKNQVNQQNQVSSSISTSLPISAVRSELTEEIVSQASSESEELTTKTLIFGKNIFNRKNLSFAPNLNIPTPEDYKLGPGDEVVIDIWGASQASVRQVISPEGSITVDRLGPVFLNGMTIKEANNYVQQKFGSLYSGIGDYEGTSQIKLTLGQIRTIQINIMGEVVVPGTYSISSLSSVFHALYNAGGINDIGSLRSIQLYRKGKLIKTIDIYEYLLNGKSDGDMRLSDGDIILVPPYISLVQIEGKVKRPMFYEMTSSETLADLIKYSGGFTGDAFVDELSLVRKTGGYDKVFTLAAANYSNFILSDGDLITIRPGLNLFENRAEIQGAIYRPGYYEIGKDIKTVKDLVVKAGGLRDNAFLSRAILTREKDDLTIENISINLNSLLNGSSSDIVLRKNDVLFIAKNDVVSDLGNFAIYGNVVNPGSYEYADNMTIEDLIVKAGGLLGSASTAKVDVARRIVDPMSTESHSVIAESFTFSIKDGLIADGNSNFTLKPYDQVYIRRSPGYIEQRDIVLEGEVLFPGRYALKEKTERISDVIKRAGNLTPHAYSQGAKLIRAKTQYEIESQRKSLRMISESGIKDSIPSDLLNIERYYSIGIELDKAVKNPKSEYDLVLKDGDRILIPEYDNTVKINGAVMYPNSVLYKKGEKVSYYIDQAGGYNDVAQKKRAYIVYMNGTVAKAKGSSREAIQPGCEIIVPSKEQKQKMTLAETISIGTSITSMASVVALLINALTK